jgi:hypothetical protein
MGNAQRWHVIASHPAASRNRWTANPILVVGNTFDPSLACPGMEFKVLQARSTESRPCQ